MKYNKELYSKQNWVSQITLFNWKLTLKLPKVSEWEESGKNIRLGVTGLRKNTRKVLPRAKVVSAWGFWGWWPLLLGSLQQKPNRQGTQMASINLRLVMICLLWVERMSLWLQCSGWVAVDGGWRDLCPGHGHVVAIGSHPRGFWGVWEELEVFG